jgi:glycosidase
MKQRMEQQTMRLRKWIWLVGLWLLAASGVSAQHTNLPWWNDRVFYEIFVRSFYDSDGDGIGDLQGVIAKLDYLNDGDPNTTDDLGITGIWLMPVSEAASYHGYDVTDYRQIEADYGTAEDFAQLIDAAHARGIAVIVDLVINHTSDQHPWFLSAQTGPDSPYADYYIWRDEHPGYSGPASQTVWHPLGDRFYYGLFWGGMPDLNYENPAVTTEMLDIARFWLEDMRVDGFRLDAVKHLIEDGPQQEHTPATLEWLGEFHRFSESVNPAALLVGEVWSGSSQVARYVPGAVDIAFEFNLALTLVDAVRRRSQDALRDIQTQALGYYPPGQYAAFLTNHDQDRVMSAFRGDVGSAKATATLLLTNPGVPFIYYGEEIGMQGQKPDERIRTPMQWTADPQHAGFSTVPAWQPPDASAAAFNVAGQTDDPDSLLSHYRRLIHLRNASPALRQGDWTPVDSGARPVYAFLRHTSAETLLIVVNLNHREITDYALSLDTGPLAGQVMAETLLGADGVNAPAITPSGGFTAYKPLDSLPPRSSLIIRLNPE